MGMAKGRSRLPKRFAANYINTSRGIDKFNMRSLDDRTFSQEVPETKHISAYDPELNVYIPSPRRIALETKLHSSIVSDQSQTFVQHLEHWTGTLRMSGYVTWNFFRIGELRLYFSRNRWVFVKVCDTFLFYSKTYASKTEALSVHKRGKIFWADKYVYPVSNPNTS
jgi:hypothetical protein